MYSYNNEEWEDPNERKRRTRGADFRNADKAKMMANSAWHPSRPLPHTGQYPQYPQPNQGRIF